jgi:DNA-3-methyladenine glycosylase I
MFHLYGYLHNKAAIITSFMNTYCDAIRSMKETDRMVHQHYHDFQYGFPIDSDDELFCRLVLEINQAGLSWTTILKKEQHFRKAYHNFNIRKVSAYGDKEITRLMNDAGIIRNRLKINAAVDNAKALVKIQKEFGSFGKWLDHHHPLKKEEWVKLFKKTFRFTGGEIVNEFLMSTGYLPGAHHEKCPVFQKIRKTKPPWMNVL